MSAAEELEFDLQSELDRKVEDALQQLRLRYETGQITEYQLEEGIRTLYRACYGLTTCDLLEKVADTYEPIIRHKPMYAVVLERLNDKLFVFWRVDSEYVHIVDMYTYDERKLLIPTTRTQHEHYLKVLNALELKGWKEKALDD